MFKHLLSFRAIIFLFIAVFSFSAFSQGVNADNQTEIERLYWDGGKKHLNCKGSYYIDDIIGSTNEKHGKWRFYDFNGELTEERNYFRDRVHGKQLTFHKDKALKTEAFFVYNVPDSSFKEWNEKGALIVSGHYQLGSPDADWLYYFEDGRLEKRQLISNDTVYLIELFDRDSLHTQIIQDGNGEIKKYYVSGGLKSFIPIQMG